MNNVEAARLIAKHLRVTDAINDLLIEAKVPGDEGEQLLLWIAGCSAGLRQAPITQGWSDMAALAWAYAAAKGGDFS